MGTRISGMGFPAEPALAFAMVTLAALGATAVAASGGEMEAAGGAAAATVQIEKGIRLASAGTPGLYEFGRKDLRIYYNSTEFGLATAQSRNGKKWKKTQSTGINVADSIVADASVVFWDGALRLYFKVVPLDDQDSHQVWRATATDDEGTAWEVDGLVYKRVGKPCLDWTSVPHAVVTHDDRVRLYFVCSKGDAQVASAVSDNGTKFKFEQVVFPDAVDPYVITEGDGYRLFYSTHVAGESARAGTFNTIFSATSEDGLEWSEGERIVSAADLGVEAAIDPAAYEYRNGRYRVYVPTSTDLIAGTDFNIYSVRYTPSIFLGSTAQR